MRPIPEQDHEHRIRINAARTGSTTADLAEDECQLRAALRSETAPTTRLLYYGSQALMLLFVEEVGQWVPREPVFAYFLKHSDRFKWTVLHDLGRITDDDDLRAAARVVAQRKLGTDKAVESIRRVRLGERDPSPAGLAGRIAEAISDHLMRYPSTTREEVLAALDDIICLARVTAPDLDEEPADGSEGCSAGT